MTVTALSGLQKDGLFMIVKLNYYRSLYFVLYALLYVYVFYFVVQTVDFSCDCKLITNIFNTEDLLNGFILSQNTINRVIVLVRLIVIIS